MNLIADASQKTADIKAYEEKVLRLKGKPGPAPPAVATEPTAENAAPTVATEAAAAPTVASLRSAKAASPATAVRPVFAFGTSVL